MQGTSGLNSRHPFNLYYNAGEYMKICGTQDGYFPDFGHHVANEMGGVWLHPIKLLDGFWLRITDIDRNISVWSRSDSFTSEPWGSRFQYDHGLGHIPVRLERVQFAPELEKGMVADYQLLSYGKGTTRLKLELLARTDLRPVWFSDEIGIIDGEQDEVILSSERTVAVKDSAHDWYVQIGTDLPGTEVETGASVYGPEFTAGNGTGVVFRSGVIELQEKETLQFRLFVAGSYESQEESAAVYNKLVSSHEELLQEKKALYEVVENRAKLEIAGEDLLNEAFKWAKWNNQWLVQKVDGIGRGLTAGGPTYPWWFGCDNTYSLQGVLAIGDAQLAKDTLNLLLQKSEEANGNGRIVHEITTMGAVSNPGNTQETAHYIAFVWELFRWTGDEELLQRHYRYCVKGIDWLLQEMDPDGDLFPSGYGIIEIAGLNMELIDSAVYTAQALQAMVDMSRHFGEEENAKKYNELADRAVRAINEVYWCESEGLYADAVASRSDIEPKVDYMVSLAEKEGIQGYREYLEKMLTEAKDAKADRGWLLNKNWVIVTPMETRIADPEKAERALETMRSDIFIGEYGTYLAGIYKQGTMTISTGVHAVAEAANGHPDEALALLRRMLGSFSKVLPGSFSEMSPDYGCVVQAWTLYALTVPVIRHFFGVTPSAHAKTVHIKPQLPTSWSDRECSLSNLKIGEAELDISIAPQQAGAGRIVTVRNPQGWNIVVELDGQRLESTETFINWAVEAAEVQA